MFRLIRKLITLAIVLAIVLGGANYLALHVAQDDVAHRAQTATRAQSASASIDGFPFLYDALVATSLPGVHIRLNYMPVGPLRLEKVDVSMNKVDLSRHDLFDHHQVRITSVANALVTATVTAQELSAAIGHQVILAGNGQVQVKMGLVTLAGQVAVVAGQDLVVRSGGVDLLSVNLADNPLVPPCTMSLEVLTGYATASCYIAPVPASVIQALS